MSPSIRLPLHLTKAAAWSSGSVDPIGLAEFIAIVQMDADLTMNIHRLASAGQDGIEFTWYALSPAFLSAEASEKRRSFLQLEHGNIVAMRPSALLFTKLKAMASTHGWRLQDRDFNSALSVMQLGPPKVALDLNPVDWLQLKTAVWSEENLPPHLGFDIIDGH